MFRTLFALLLLLTLPFPAARADAESIVDTYTSGQRTFSTLDTADGGHLLRITTHIDPPDVLEIALPWTASFDSFHIGEDEDELFILYPDAWLEEDYWGGYLTFGLHDGRWELGVLNNGWEVIVFDEYAVYRDVDTNVTFGVHPWQTLDAIDWTAFPLTFAALTATLEKQGWLFAHGETTLLAAPDLSSSPLATCPADTALAVLRIDGDWAFVGLHADNLRDYTVGYVPMEALRAEPESVLPGGETDGWFYTMTVTDGLLQFAPISGAYMPDYTPIRVDAEFAQVARALYRAQGYAATPARFDPALYEHTLDLYWDGGESLRDLFLMDTAAVMAIERDGRWSLSILTDPSGARAEQTVYMPGPFHFDREAWQWGVISVVPDYTNFKLKD